MIQPEDVCAILKLKLSHIPTQDLIGWHYTSSSTYTVKSGYWLSTHLPDQELIHPPPDDTRLKKAIWKLNTVPKIRHFLWRILSKALAVGTILKHRGIILDSQCRCCYSDEESLAHLFSRCGYAQAIWRNSHVVNTVILDPTATFESKIQGIIDTHNNRHLSELMRQSPLWIFWKIWKSRNLILYQKQSSDWRRDIKKLTEKQLNGLKVPRHQ